MYCGLVLLAACTIPAFFIKRGAYAQHRVRTLAVNMIVTMTVPWFFLHPACVVHSTNDPAAHMAISAIALIFNVCVFVYQAYTIFGKKRNPFKQELYIDNPGFRKVYLESIDLPEGQRARFKEEDHGHSVSSIRPYGVGDLAVRRVRPYGI